MFDYIYSDCKRKYRQNRTKNSASDVQQIARQAVRRDLISGS